MVTGDHRVAADGASVRCEEAVRPTTSGCHPERGALINALATAGARRVEAEEALARCPARPEATERRLMLGGKVATRRAEEADARRALEWWETILWINGLGTR